MSMVCKVFSFDPKVYVVILVEGLLLISEVRIQTTVVSGLGLIESVFRISAYSESNNSICD